MNKLLDILSDIRVMAVIAIVIVVLVIWLIVTKVKTSKFKTTLNEYEKKYNDIKSIPLSFKMQKAGNIGRIDEVTTKKVSDASEVFNKYESGMSAIAQSLADVEDDINGGKLKRAKDVLSGLDEQLVEIGTAANTLNDMLDEILAKEVSQRQQVTNYKNRFRALKSEAQVHSSELSYCWENLEQRFATTESMFSAFEEWMYSSDYNKANDELKMISESLDGIEKSIEVLPALLKDARGVIPSMAENLHKNYTSVRNKGVYLKHIEIENNLSALTVSLKDDLKNLKSGNTEGIRDHLDSYKERITQLDDAISNEGNAFDEVRELAVETEEQFTTVENSLNYVKDNFSHTSVKFGLEGMDNDLRKREDEFKKIQAEKPRVMANVHNYQIPPSTALVSLKELNGELSDIAESLSKMKSKIENANGDEERARKQLIKLQIIMNQIRVNIRKYKLPNISKQYEEDMLKADTMIGKLNTLMKQNPLNIQIINSNLSKALDFIYRLYNDVNNVVGTVVMVENTIVFGNRYRSTYSDIDSELTRAELAFRNGEYTQALSMAIKTIEKIHPGNYESMIKENAKGA